MKINLSKNDLNKIERLIDMKYLNIEADELFQDYLQNDYLSVNEKDIENLVCTQAMSKKEALLTSLLMNKDISPEDPEVIRMREAGIFDRIDCLNDLPYKKNPFELMLKTLDAKEGDWCLTGNYYQPYEIFLYDDVYSNPENYFSERNSIGCFEEKVPYIVLTENDVVWMSITPFEINTMKSPVADAFGNVVTFGLGLGYFTYMAVNNPNVEHVTVVEKDAKAIKIFENEILPRIRLKDKITIIKDDAFHFMKNKMRDGDFDYAFFDIYHSADDGLESYLKMKKLERLSEKTQYRYWIESSLLSFLRRFFITIIEESLNGMTEEDYESTSTFEEKLLHDIYFLTKDEEFKTYGSVKEYLKDDHLRNLAKKL